MVWYSHLFQNFPQFVVIHTVKGFGIVKKADIDVFLELSCFFNDPADVGNLISGSSAFSKTSLNISPSNEHPGLISLQSKGLSSQRLWHSQESRNRSFSWNVLAFSMIQWMLAIERGDQGADRLKLQSQTTSQLDHRTTSCLTQ